MSEIRGYRRRQLLEYLATGEKTQRELGEMFGVTQQAVSGYATRYREEVDAIRAQLDDQFAGMWIAQKHLRVEEYASQVERANEILDTAYDPAVAKVVTTALRSVAEELGQLPTRLKVDHGKIEVTYTLEGTNTKDLT